MCVCMCVCVCVCFFPQIAILVSLTPLFTIREEQRLRVTYILGIFHSGFEKPSNVRMRGAQEHSAEKSIWT
jgi:hypothetical protein